jgi:hypothetical protein
MNCNLPYWTGGAIANVLTGVRRSGLVAMTAAFAVAMGMVGAPAGTVGATSAAMGDQHRNTTLFATAQAGEVLLSIDVDAGTSRNIGSTGFPPQSLALAITPDGTAAYTIANAQAPAEAHLAKIDLTAATEALVGTHSLETDLYIMGMTLAPDGVLCASGDFDPSSPTFNSLYTIDVNTGLASRVGSFDAGSAKSAYIMSFGFDPDGTMYGASMMSLYTIDRITGAATRVADFSGASTDPSKVMGIAFDGNGRLYAADYVDLSDGGSTIYSVNRETGVLTPLFRTGVAFVHNIAFGPLRTQAPAPPTAGLSPATAALRDGDDIRARFVLDVPH